VPKDVQLARVMPGLESTVRGLTTLVQEGNRSLMDSQSALTREVEALRESQTESSGRVDRGLNNIQIGLYNHNNEV
jgi:hypothetical protein